MAGDMYSVASSGDFGLVVKLKTERNLTGNEKYLNIILSPVKVTSFQHTAMEIARGVFKARG